LTPWTLKPLHLFTLKPQTSKEPTEALLRASRWKDEAKSLFTTSPNPKQSVTAAVFSSRLGGGHLPKWVLESFGGETAGAGQGQTAAGVINTIAVIAA
jgi:hypothetical protein